MKLYHIKKHGKQTETYVTASWPNEIDKHGLLNWFESGKGWSKTKLFEVVDVDLQPKKDALYIGEVATKYSYEVAVDLCERSFGCCTMSAEKWVYTFKAAYEVAMQHFTESERELIAREVVNKFRSFFGFDICFLDKALSEMDKEYSSSRCTYKDRENVSMGMYIKEKYGEVTARFVDKCIDLI